MGVQGPKLWLCSRDLAETLMERLLVSIVFQEREWSKPFTHAHRLTSKQLKDLAQMTHDEKAIIYLVPQSHGQMMIVLAGWVHCVTNLRMCGKLAWNFYKPTNMAQYFEAAQQSRESSGSSNAPGYVWNGAVLISCISLIASEIR